MVRTHCSDNSRAFTFRSRLSASQISSAGSSEMSESPKHKGRRASGISMLFKSMDRSSCAFADSSLKKKLMAITKNKQILDEDRLSKRKVVIILLECSWLVVPWGHAYCLIIFSLHRRPPVPIRRGAPVRVVVIVPYLLH